MNIKEMIRLNCIVLFTLLLISCSQYSKEEVVLYIRSELADCEEQNVHFKIIKVMDTTKLDLVGSFVLPVCQDEACKEDIYSVTQFDTTLVFEVKGYFSRNGHNKKEYGCVGAHMFKISESAPVSSSMWLGD